MSGGATRSLAAPAYLFISATVTYVVAMRRVGGERQREGRGGKDFRMVRFSQQEHLNTSVDKKEQISFCTFYFF